MFGKGTGWISITALFGLVAGGTLGYLIPSFMGLIGVFGEFFIYALVVAAFVQFATSSLLAAEQVGQRAKLGRVTLRVAALYLLMGLIGGLIGLLATIIFSPGQGVNQIVSDLHQDWAPLTAFSLTPGLLGGFVLLVLLIGIGVVGMGARFRAASNLIGLINQMAARSVSMLTYVMPVGLFALAAGLVASDAMLRTSIAALIGSGPDAAGIMMNSVWGYLLTVLAGLLVIGFILLPLALKMFGHLPVVDVLRNIGPAMVTAFGSGASLTAYPFMQTAFTEKLNTDNRVTGLVLPLGNLMNLTATSFVTVVAVLFMAQTAGVELSLGQYLAILIVPLFLALGKVGLPAMTLVILSVIIAMLRFPAHVVAGLGMILVADWLVERLKAVVNVMSDATVVGIAGEFFEFKTARASRDTRRTQPLREKKDHSRGRSDRSGPDRRRSERADSRRGRDARPQERRPAPRQSERVSQKKEADDRRHDSRVRIRTAEKSPFEMNAEQPPQFDVDLSQATASTPKQSVEKRSSEPSSPRPERRRTTRSADSRQESRSRRTDRQKPGTETADEAQPSSATSRARLSPDTIARELQKVSAHLEQFEVDESSDKKSADDTIDMPIVKPEPAKATSDKKPEPEVEKSQLTIDLSTMNGSGTFRAVAESGDKPTESREMTAPSDAGVVDAPQKVDSEPADEPAIISYGRGRSSRAEKPKPVAKTSEATEDSEKPKDGFSQANVSSFGRGKRKKTK